MSRMQTPILRDENRGRKKVADADPLFARRKSRFEKGRGCRPHFRATSKRGTHRKVRMGIRQLLRPLRRHRGVPVLHRPIGRNDFEPRLHRLRERLFGAELEEHGVPVRDEAPAESERSHEAGGQDGGAPCVAEAQGALQGRQQLEAVGAGKPVPRRRLLLHPIEDVHEEGDGV
jgi:hypothetical protein